MKNKAIAILLCLSCILALSGCGKEAAVSEPSASETPQTFGNTAVESPDTAQTVPEADSTGSRVTPAAEESAVSQSVMAAILCDQDGLTYDPEDPVYFWRAVGYLVSMRALDTSLTGSTDGAVSVTPEKLDVFVQAMFGGYSGEVPAVTEEDPLVSMADNGDYLIHAPEMNLTLNLGEITPAQDGGYTAQAELISDGENQGVYQVSLTDYTGPENGKSLFQYSLTGITKLSG